MLTYVEDGTVDLVGVDERGGEDRASGGPPGGDTPGHFTGDVAEVDVQRRPEDVGGVLVGVADDDDRDGGVEQPAEPGGELCPQRDRHRAGYVPGGDVVDRTHVNDDRPGANEPPYRRRVERRQGWVAW